MSDAYTEAVIRDLQRETDGQNHLISRLQIENASLQRRIDTLEAQLRNCRKNQDSND